MKIQTPRTKSAEVRLEELMNAALDLFATKGFEATTVNEIVEKAKVAKGTFYNYFTSKTEILQALRQRYLDSFLAVLNDAVAACDRQDIKGQLKAWLFTCVDQYIKTYEEHDIVFSTSHHFHRDNPEKNAFLQNLMLILDKGNAQGIWQCENTAYMSLFIYSAVHGITDVAIIENIKDCSEFVESINKNVLKMLKPE